MKIGLFSVSRDRSQWYEAAVDDYLNRIGRFADVEALSFASEAALLARVDRLRAAPMLVLLDGRGKMVSSEELAGWLGRQRDGGMRALVFAVGPADGWSEAARARAGWLLSLGPMTLAHELARVVLAEQVYRAFTILAGHPYHRE